MQGVQAMGWVSRREAARDIVFLALAFLLSAGVAALFLDDAYGTWAGAHGRGTLGTWTATYPAGSKGRINWYGNFTPNNGGPARPNVGLANNVIGLHVGRSIPAAMLNNDRVAFATTDTRGWVPSAIFGGVFAVLASAVAWFTVHHLRAPRRVAGHQLSQRTYTNGFVTQQPGLRLTTDAQDARPETGAGLPGGSER
ncbi:hypothetical protein [Rugosimonospora africana]|uniref:Uncharacterized protein n=1 Tax=Rugosimonospora africana TaxID=556532 RepID=A0A8J3VN59_9ACTN|nr:hypothetical protein [Rugosimonospora africana]GIH12492.1 hypothetical protein Raf01_06640 [Rugosimonospora africana]